MSFEEFGVLTSVVIGTNTYESITTVDGNTILFYLSGGVTRVQLFDPTGQAIGQSSVLPVNSFPQQIVALSDGNIAFVTSGGTAVRVFDSSLQTQLFSSVVSAPSPINPDISIVAVPTGGFIASWSRDGTGTNSTDVEFEIFNSEGNSTVGPVTLDLSGSQFSPAIAYDNSLSGSSDFRLYYIETGTNDLYFQAYSDTGSPTGTIRQVNTSGGTVSQYEVVTLSNDTHVVVWEDGSGVFTARLANSLSPSPIVTSLDVDGVNPSIVATADGGYIVAWINVAFSGNSAQVQQFNASGSLIESQSFSLAQAVDISVTDDGILSVFVRENSGTLLVNLFTIDANNLSFTNGADEKDGDALDNVMHGLGGDDELGGEGGNDIITGGTGEDILRGGTGDDHFYETGPSSEIDQYDGGDDTDTLFAIGEFYAGGVTFDLTTGRQIVNGSLRDFIVNIENLTIGGDATIIGDGGSNVLIAFDNGDTGDNTIEGGKGDDVLRGGGGNDTLNGGEEDDDLYGDAGNDTLNGGTGKNVIFGGTGDDTIIASGGTDDIDGGEGVDTLDYSFYDNDSLIDLTNEKAEHQSGEDTVRNIENVIAGDGEDNIIGGDEDNNFIGNDGDDTFTGGLGNDIFNGGIGDDEVNYSDSTQAVTINLATGSTSGGTAQSDTYISIEDVRGSNFDDTLIGDSEANRLNGAGGDDLLDGGLGADLLIGGSNTSVGDTVTYAASAGTVIVNLTTGGVGNHADGDTYSGIENVIGTDFQDSITGNGFNNVLYGGLGDDFLFGEGGNDLLEGLTGGDTLTGGSGSDTVTYALSDAGVTISLIDDTASGGHATGDDLNEIENIIGSNHQDVLIGNDEANTLEGGDEDDSFVGGLGADTLIGGEGFDIASYADSTVGVTVSLRDGMPVGVGGTAEGDTLSGIEGLIGSDHDDTLTGQENLVRDFISSGEGHDTIFTRGGDDTIIAGGGNDHIIVRLNFDSLANSGDIAGGIGTDTLDFSATGPSSNSEIIADLSTQTMTFIARPNTMTEFTVVDEVTFSSIESLVGASSQDHLTGNSGNNTLRGLIGNDTLIGGAGADILDGGEGNDTVDYSASSAGVTIDLTAGTGTGGDAQGDTLIDIEFVIGSDHNDTVRGNMSPNRFTLGQGNDTAIVTNMSFLNDYDGGSGVDTVSFAELSGSFNIDLDLVNGSVGSTDLIDFENVIDNAGDSNIAGNEMANTFTILGGDDEVDGLGGTDSLVLGGNVRDWAMRLLNATESWIENTATGDRVTFQSIERIFAGASEVGYQISTGFGATLNGSNQSDILIGDAGGNAINGLGGDDILFGREGNDTIDGGADFDRAVLEAQLLDYSFSLGASGEIIATDTVGSAGTDTLTDIEMIQFNQSFVADLTLNLNVIAGNNGNNNLMGSALDEIIIGGAGNDNLVAVGGNDALFGGDDDDILFSGSGADLLDGGDGNDTADYSQSDAGVRVRLGAFGNPTGLGYAEGDTLVSVENIVGSNFDDELLGDNGINILRGGDGNDILNGFEGNDIFYGGEGDDNSGGGSGDDLFFGSAGADSFNGGNGGETIGDTVDYSASMAGITANLELAFGTGGDAEGDSYTRIERVIGSQFDDVFVGAAGAQTFIGGDGTDTISYIDASSRVVVNLLTNIHSQTSAAGDNLIDIENIIGTFSNDNLTGDTGNNVIEAWTGNNTINGGDGIDTMAYTLADMGVTVDLSLTTVQSTGISTDTISNVENLRGSDFDDVLRGNSGVNLLEGGLGDDILEGRGNGDTLNGGAGVDTASYENATAGVTVNMGTGVHSGPDAAGDMFISIENLIGSGLGDTLTGDMNANVIEGGLGTDNLDGGDGIDTASYAGASTGVTVSLALQGSAQNTGVTGTDTLNNFENLLGSIHADTLTGDGEANTIEGGLGDDTIDGGGGSDTASYVNNAFGVVVDLTQQGIAQDTLNAGLDTLSGIENLQGSEAGDLFTGDANANVLIGAGGIDMIDGGGGADTIFGGTDGDTLNGQDGSDTIFGQEGNDTILGGAETDFLLGGDGVDTIFGEDGADQLFGENGDDTLFGQQGDDILLGGIGNDVLVGGEGTDTFFGEVGNDQLFGEGGGDVLFGQDGTDIIIAGTGGDFAFGGDDTDTIYGEDGNDQLFGENGGDVIFGQVGEDIIYGGQGGDFLFGGDDTDTIYGGTETDLLFGGMGGDVLFGEDGDDRIEGNEGGDFIFGGDGVDTVFGGDDVDQIHGDGDGDVLNGGAGDDNLFGGDGGDFLFGDTGTDRLNGGVGNDQLYGGSNGVTDPGTQDIFGFETGFGIDTIHDYEVGVDRVEFSGISGLNNFGDLIVTETNGNAIVSFGADSITFIGVSAATLNVNSLDFDFV